MVALLAGCGDGAPDLMNFAASNAGPDEFLVVPNKPLETPPDLAALPPPGGVSRAEPDPRADAVAALGGSPAAIVPSGQVAAGDGALVNHASRYGRDPAIRAELAEDDLEFRRRNDGLFLERAFNRNIYYDSYARQQLDQQAELDRFRRAGVKTPAAPPPELRPE